MVCLKIPVQGSLQKLRDGGFSKTYIVIDKKNSTDLIMTGVFSKIRNPTYTGLKYHPAILFPNSLNCNSTVRVHTAENAQQLLSNQIAVYKFALSCYSV